MVSGLIVIGLTSASAATRRVPSEYPTIKAAVDASDHGDTVLIADGTYSGNGNRNINMRYKDIVVTSENGAGTCIVECGGADFGFVLTTGSIQGLTIQNADGSGQGYGVLFDWGGGALSDCIIHGCNTGIYVDHAFDIDIERCTIYGSHSRGAICVNSGTRFFNCEIDHEDNYAVWNRDLSWMEMNNCRVTGTVFTQAASETYLAQCTVIGGIEAYMECMVALSHCIQWNGGIDYDYTSGYSVTYSNTEIPYAGAGNISEDPMFVTGPGGAYYLSQVAAGQAADSPCVDAGETDASETCFQSETVQYCMSDYVTRSDEGFDAGIVDMGYHYPEINTKPGTPTPTPTQFPTATPTPDPTATPTQGDIPGVDLVISGGSFTGGEHFLLEAVCMAEETGSYDLYVMLDFYGYYLFYPDWRETLGGATLDLDAMAPRTETILDFIWPELGFGNKAVVTFWGMLTREDTFDIEGAYDYTSFQYMYN